VKLFSSLTIKGNYFLSNFKTKGGFMIRNCGNCKREIEVEKWVECPDCGYHNHFKVNKRGRLKKHTCHPPKENNLYLHLRK